MKIITGNVGEPVSVIENIDITILDVQGSQVWIGITKPDDQNVTDCSVKDSSQESAIAPLIAGEMFTGDVQESKN